MDTIVNLAKQGIEAYEKSQGGGGSQENENLQKTGGSEYNRPSHSQHEGRSVSPNFDEEYAVKKAAKEGSGEESLFSSAFRFLKSNKDSKEEPVDEESVTSAHREVYEKGSGQNVSPDLLGKAAALQAFKSFVSGSSGKEEEKKKDTKTDLISMAMSEASKLFDKSGGSSSGGKQDAVNSAAVTVVKLLVQSKFSQTTGGSNSGGLSGLLSLASKFA